MLEEIKCGEVDRKLEYGLHLMVAYRYYLEEEKEYGRYCDYLE